MSHAPTLTNADLRHADFTGSDLEHAIGVTVEQLKAAQIYHSTMLPPDLGNQFRL